MKSFFKHPVMAFLSSLKLGAALLIIIAWASGYATFYESSWGRDGAYDVIYAARWFEIVLAVFTVNLILNFVRRWPYEARDSGYMLVHAAVVVILLSAGMTRYLGYEGVMPIREGQTTDFIYSDKVFVQLEADGIRSGFPVRLHRPGQKNIWRGFSVNGTEFELGVTEHWSHFTERYEQGGDGPAALRFGVREGGDVHDHVMVAGESLDIGGVDTRFLRLGFRGEMTASRLGEVRVRVDGQTCLVPMGWPAGDPVACGDWTFAVAEFQTDFRVGGPSSADGPLNNPMVKLAITAPDGTEGERVLFALHPDFSMGHSGGETIFEDLDMLYSASAGLEFAQGGATGVQGRASFELATLHMETEERGVVAAGEIFDIQPSVLLSGKDGGFAIIPVEVWESAARVPAESDDPDDPAAARLAVRDDQGNEAEIIVRKHRENLPVKLGERTVKLGWGSIMRKLPYSLHLDDFVLQTYPGSDNPATYESYVTLRDPEMGIEGQEAHIYMNHPLNHRGSKHFQSSYDPDRQGTVLSVNHDPGKWPTYFGYTLISVGFILVLLKDLIWRRKRPRSLGSVAVALTAVALTAAWSGTTLAQEDGQPADDPHAGHNHAPGEHPTSGGWVTLTDVAREEASRLTVQDYRGRMKPLDTMARELVMKVYKRTKVQHEGETRNPIDVYLSWSLNATYWYDQPVIGVRNAGLKDLLGVSADTKHVSLSSLIENGRYRLSEAVEAAHRTPDRERSKTQRKLITFDERAQLLNMAFQGSQLRLFPVVDDANDTWLDIRSVTARVPGPVAETYESAFRELAGGIQGADNGRILGGVRQIEALQRENGARVIPSAGRVNAELSYNRGHIFSWAMIPFLGAFVILMTVYVVNLFRHGGAPLSFRNPFYSLGVILYSAGFLMQIYAYTLRWIASGRAPLSNGHESLLFISLAVALAGLVFELVSRMGVPAGLGGLLTVIVLGVSMLSTFDPAIGPLVPVLVSYWLNIHVTIITASYGFLGLSHFIGALILILYLVKKPGRQNVKEAIARLDGINYNVMVAGLGLLTIGTLLGGVWANESWGRYWGWDAKETWSLVTILVYATVLHFRFIPRMKSAWLTASLATAAIGSVVMTYFGVNYFLSGLHSYAQGDVATVPGWVYIFTLAVLALIAVSGLVHANRKWEEA
ncbi:MAG: cytochrome c biogenesis protein CcsA [bacterium]|nr:cytochrome c biogenesis protein CcsA [bacterium]